MARRGDDDAAMQEGYIAAVRAVYRLALCEQLAIFSVGYVTLAKCSRLSRAETLQMIGTVWDVEAKEQN